MRSWYSHHCFTCHGNPATAEGTAGVHRIPAIAPETQTASVMELHSEHCIKTDKTLSNQQQQLRELKYHTGTVKIFLVLCYLVQQHLKKLLLTELWHTDLPKNPNRLRECLKTQLDHSQAE